MINTRAVIVNKRQWQSAMNTWLKAKRGASHDDCINKFGSESCFTAMRYTPKARVGKINAYDPKKGGRTFRQRLLFAMAAKNGITKGGGKMTNYVNKVFNSRKRSIGAVKAGFIRPAMDLGKPMRIKPYSGGSASKSRGYKSKRFKMKAISFNEVDGAGEVAYQPMNRAMAFTIQREHNWAIRRLQKANNAFSAKRY
tara:strand:- start:772 stop:1362 length:591 start_codon:yes stop_codon:yes gene_type:complete